MSLNKKSKAKPRYPELDILKTLAVLGMVYYHSFFFAAQFEVISTPPTDNFFYELIGHFARTSFVILVGINSHLSMQNRDLKSNLHHFSNRSLKIGAAALLITIFSAIYIPEAYIQFGILHFIAVTLLFVPLINFSYLTLALTGLTAITITQLNPSLNQLTGCTSENYICLISGISPPTSLDYFSLSQWLPYVCLGLLVGRYLYSGLRTGTRTSNKFFQTTEFISKHSLAIYILHLPLLALFFYFLKNS